MINKESLSPIILFTYDRLIHTRQTINYLKENQFAEESILIVYSDAPKDATKLNGVREVRKYLASVKGFKQVEIIERERNLGLTGSIETSIPEIIKIYKKAIILEDDLITSPFFLSYMNEALELYQFEEKVASIHGYCYPVRTDLPGTFFIKGADCWGWGTWERAWNFYEKDAVKLLNELKKAKLEKEFNFNNSYNYLKLLKDQTKGKNLSWAVKWYASAFLADMVTLYPYPTLIQNIGFDNTGSNPNLSKRWNSPINESPLVLEKIEIKEDKLAREAFEAFFQSLWRINNIVERIINKVRSKVFKFRISLEKITG
ncbi:MAG: glycosyltransferase family 2 protein [Bacteroidia bacterium]|nr:glycosyltransferase family 2 protein [Bacteroidia bacterium]